MKLPQVRSCCCGCTLKKGTLIIGNLEMISSIILVIDLALGSVKTHKAMQNTSLKPEAYDALKMDLAVGIVLLVYSVLYFCMAVVLLFGVYKDRAVFVRVYVIFFAVIVVIGCVLYIWKAIVSATAIEVTKSIASSIIHTVFGAYFLIVVNSYYHAMKRGSSTHAPA